MTPHPIIRLSILLSLASSLPAQAQHHPRPSSQPAPIPATAPTTAAPPPPPTPAQSPATPAKITWQAGQLTISANNSSLNQILHQVSQLAGITMSGGVADERVFGDYGPAPASQVLNQLLDGTSSNMLFIGSDQGRPAQLILTPRNGAPTPPSPNTTRFNQEAEASTQPVNPPPPPGSENAPTSPSVAASPAPPNASNPETAPSGSAPTSTDPNQQSPNGVKTPQQIYNDLMKLRQQQQQSK